MTATPYFSSPNVRRARNTVSAAAGVVALAAVASRLNCVGPVEKPETVVNAPGTEDGAVPPIVAAALDARSVGYASPRMQEIQRVYGPYMDFAPDDFRAAWLDIAWEMKEKHEVTAGELEALWVGVASTGNVPQYPGVPSRYEYSEALEYARVHPFSVEGLKQMDWSESGIRAAIEYGFTAMRGHLADFECLYASTDDAETLAWIRATVRRIERVFSWHVYRSDEEIRGDFGFIAHSLRTAHGWTGDQVEELWRDLRESDKGERYEAFAG